jgi:hypothetical protein
VKAALFTIALLGLAAPAYAQTPAPAPPAPGDGHRFNVSAGITWAGGYPLGDAVASTRRNATGTSTPPSFTLFRADTELTSASGMQARIGFGLIENLSIEVAGSMARPRLAISIAEDPETEATTLAGSEVTQYIVDVGAVYSLPWTLGNRTTPYAVVSFGYLRQLHEDRSVVETGRTLQFGGGARFWLRGTEASNRAVGVRAEFAAVMRTGGVDFADARRTFPTFQVLGTIGCRKMLCR